MARYLVRVANNEKYTPKDAQQVAATIRSILGSRESVSHFRVATNSIEFNMFARNETELNERKRLLTEKLFDIVGTRLLDVPSKTGDKDEALAEGVQFFNEERYWECHEALERAWHESKGIERDAIQGIILTAAAFVHYQKGEEEICVSILGRARTKMASAEGYEKIDVKEILKILNEILSSEKVRLFKLRISRL